MLHLVFDSARSAQDIKRFLGCSHGVYFRLLFGGKWMALAD